MFDIVGDDIASLNDTDLRALVTRLCEAEIRHNKLPVSAITAGGNQDAADGGLDVRIELPEGRSCGDFIPRPNTGFQVKVPDMPRSEIIKEMRPKGTLRPVIQEIAEKSGAYIIVSSNGSLADRALKDRRDAIRDAIADDPNATKLAVDFYDRERIAAWVRQYPGISSWIRQRLGKPLEGWQPFGNWSAPAGPSDAEYIVDGKSRLHDDRFPREDGLSIEHGINRIRETLAKQSGAARLIGLSGMGKTRLAEALFDSRIGEKALPPSEVIYTDVADHPVPPPRDVIQYFIRSNQRAIIIIDNCNPSMHRSLAMACSVIGSRVSLLTIEYDVGDDDPEGTDVFRLEAASDSLIEQLIEGREPQILHVDRRRIAEFSGGNARVALALARTVQRGETLGQLTDRDLFGRLFHQRQPEDRSLLQAAEACSLVYSFDGETTLGAEAELPILAELAGLTVDELYRHIQELKSRDLLQKRSKWRAILPHALANRLARNALEGMLPSKVAELMTTRAPGRLLKSFSRRLGYLHDCEAAHKIVQEWVSKTGSLGKLETLTPLGWEIFHNIAPVAPPAVLDALESALTGEMSSVITDLNSIGRYKIGKLLRSLAYEAEHFQRASSLLSRFAIAEPADHNHNSVGRIFYELFHLYLSGTHALGPQRLKAIEFLLSQTNKRTQECGIAALDAMLEAWHFHSSHEFDFGARPRDYGWQPETNEEIQKWYTDAVKFAVSLIVTEHPLSEKLKEKLAGNFRALWIKAHLFDGLEDAVYAIVKKGFWAEGWAAAKQTIRFDAENMPADILARLNSIENVLKPGALIEKARAYVFLRAWGAFDLADTEEDEPAEVSGSRYERAEQITQSLGREVANSPAVLNELLPELARGSDGGRRWAFGMGLADGAADLTMMWNNLKSALRDTPEDDRNIQSMRGFLAQAARLAPDLASSFFDEGLTEPALRNWFPILQGSTEIDDRGVRRLRRSLELGFAPIWTYGHLAIGRLTDPISDQDLCDLLSTIHGKPEGQAIAIDILHMKLHSLKSQKALIDRNLLQLGRRFLEEWSFEERTALRGAHRDDYELASLVDDCLQGPDATETATVICEKLAAALLDYSASTHDYHTLMRSLFRAQPHTALDTFVRTDNSNIARQLERGFLSEEYRPIDEVPDEVLIIWANKNPDLRFPALAAVTSVFVSREGEAIPSLSPKALLILENGPSKLAVLARFEARLHPNSWSGSLADVLDKRRQAISPLLVHADPDISGWAARCDQELSNMAQRDRSRERRRDESFE